MNFRYTLAVMAVMLVLPVASHAEDGKVVQSETLPSGYKETLVLKGYRVRSAYPVAPSAPVAGQPYYYENEVFVPVEEMESIPPASGTENAYDPERKDLTLPRNSWAGNE